MARKKQRFVSAAKPAPVADSRERVAEMVAHAASGAAGVHADQKTRRNGTYRTNRVGSRSAAKRAAVRDSF